MEQRPVTWALLAGVLVAAYVLYRTFRRKPPPPPDAAPEPATEAAPAPEAAAEGDAPIATAEVVPAAPRVSKDELVEMIDSVIEQYEEEIREMTPAQQKSKKASWEQIEDLQQMTQIDFSEEVIERFWGYRKGTTPEIPNTKKLSLGRGVWYTMPQPDKE